MISKLTGLVDSIGLDYAVIDVGGVGYHVACSGRTMERLPGVGEPATLFVETLMTQDAIRLVGFSAVAERDWFRLLLSVQGVGTKVALAVLSTFDPGQLASAIAMGDKAMVTKVPGVGPRVAQRIISELKDKAPALGGVDPSLQQVGAGIDAGVPAPAADAVSALVNLGYGQTQAGAAVAAVIGEAGDEGAETLIRLALKKLASG